MRCFCKVLEEGSRYLNVVFVADPLHKWSRRVSYAIGPDWPKLYRVLPFVPERSDVERDEDIVKIFTGKWR